MRVANYYFRMAADTYERVHFRTGELFVRGEMCTAGLRSRNLRSARNDCMEAAALAEQLHDPKRIAITMWRLGQLDLASGETQQAIGALQSAARISRSVHDTRFEAQARMGSGRSVIWATPKDSGVE